MIGGKQYKLEYFSYLLREAFITGYSKKNKKNRNKKKNNNKKKKNNNKRKKERKKELEEKKEKVKIRYS